MEPIQNTTKQVPVQPAASVNKQVEPQAQSQKQGLDKPVNLSHRLVPEKERLGKLGDLFDEKTLKKMGYIECATCANRQYQDQSDDGGVSFQAPTRLSPGQAATAVAAHEQEHVVREQAHAEEEGREVVRQSVQIHTSICSECGRTYVSGGLTTTVTRGKTQGYDQTKPTDYQGNLIDYQV